MGFLEELTRRQMTEEKASKEASRAKLEAEINAGAARVKKEKQDIIEKEASWQKARDQYGQSGVGRMLREAVSDHKAISMDEDKNSKVTAGGLTFNNPNDYFSARLVLRQNEFEIRDDGRGLYVRSLYEYYVDIIVKENGTISFVGGRSVRPTVLREEWIRNKDTLAKALVDAYRNPQESRIKELSTRSTSGSLGEQYYKGQDGPCLPGDSLISTPSGFVQVENLRSGDLVWTVNGLGQKIQAPILLKTRRLVSGDHKMAHIDLEDGRKLIVSPGHPTIGNKELGSLKKGQILDNSKVSSINIMPYKEKYTYDILPAGDTGVYWANGILIGSTLSAQFKKTQEENYSRLFV